MSERWGANCFMGVTSVEKRQPVKEDCAHCARKNQNMTISHDARTKSNIDTT